MSTYVRWGVAAGAAVLVVCLLALAQGQDHHRGDDVGSLDVVTAAVAGPRTTVTGP
jgi:hypothetical protein